MKTGPPTPVNSKHVGDGSEATVVAALVRRGYTVSRPFGDNDAYDLVLDDGGTLHRVQVKTGWREGDCIRFKTCSTTTRGGERVTTDYDAEDVDAFAVRDRDDGGLYWVPFADAGSKNTYLRVGDAAIDHPTVNEAAAYAFDANLPPLPTEATDPPR